MASLLSKIFRRKPNLKQWFTLPFTGGAINGSWGENWWQRGYSATQGATVAAVESCVDAYAQTIASIPVAVYDLDTDGSQVVNRTLAAGRVLRSPNDYQTRSDFLLNGVKALFYHGNCYAVAIRNDRNEVSQMHLLPPGSTQPYVVPDTKDIFYGLGENPLLPEGLSAMIPARDVLHIRLYCPNHPLVGVTPLRASAASIAANGNISRHQAAFFERMSRPSGILTTDKDLDADQMAALRARWDEQSKGLDSGGVPVLGSGMRWETLSINSQDAQLIDAFNMTVTDIARSMRVPLPIVNIYDNATYNNVEQLYNQWLAGGLGFLLEHVERALDKFFGLPATQAINFDADSFVRMDFEKKVEGYSKLVQSGMLTPNEGRVKTGKLPKVANGDQPIVQQQMVPLGWTEAQQEQAPAEPVAQDFQADYFKTFDGMMRPQGSAEVAA